MENYKFVFCTKNFSAANVRKITDLIFMYRDYYKWNLFHIYDTKSIDIKDPICLN